MHQCDAQCQPGKGQREIVTRSLGVLQRLLDVAHHGVVSHQHPTLIG